VSTVLKSTGCERDDARNRFRALFVVGHHAAAEPKRAHRCVERVGLALAPILECVRRHGCAILLLGEPPERIRRDIDVIRPNNIGAVFADARLRKQFRRTAKRFIDAKRRDETREINLALATLVLANAQGPRLLVRLDTDDARQSFLGHDQPRSLSSAHLRASIFRWTSAHDCQGERRLG
jgi:hypothetical protein